MDIYDNFEEWIAQRTRERRERRIEHDNRWKLNKPDIYVDYLAPQGKYVQFTDGINRSSVIMVLDNDYVGDPVTNPDLEKRCMEIVIGDEESWYVCTQPHDRPDINQDWDIVTVVLDRYDMVVPLESLLTIVQRPRVTDKTG